jgi:serine/threonine protein phosphatase PrpC
VIWRGRAYVAQIGDSRAYLVRLGALHQITEDQTLVNDLVAQGSLTPEQAKVHPQRNMITQALGSPQPLRVVLSRLDLCQGDRLLCCSDGLHGEVADAVILDTLSRGLSPRQCLDRLVEEALASGGRDNITGILMALDDPSLPMASPGEVPDLVHPSRDSERPGLWARLVRWFRGGGQ